MCSPFCSVTDAPGKLLNMNEVEKFVRPYCHTGVPGKLLNIDEEELVRLPSSAERG